MRRRAFLSLAGAAAAAPRAAVAQQPATPVIGYLSFIAIDALPYLLAAFHKGLATEGFVEGQNVTIEYRATDARTELLPDLAADLVRRQVAVIVAIGPPAAVAAKRATQTIPIVFASGRDPVHIGLVSSFNRPGGNITGVYFLLSELVAKRLALLHELLPGAKRIAVLVNPANAWDAEQTTRNAAVLGRTLGLEIQFFNASTSGEIDASFAAIASWRPEALFVGPDPFFSSQRVQLVTLAARQALPGSYGNRELVEVGGLMSYGPHIADSYRQIGVSVGRILKGDRPGDLAVVQPTRFEMVLNLRTAKALGLTIPPLFLAQADEVIE